MINETHDPTLASWVASANQARCDFPIQNLPFAVFRRKGRDEPFRGGVAIGDQIVDLGSAHAGKAFDGRAAEALGACAQPGLNACMALGPAAWHALRLALSRALRQGAPPVLRPWLVPQDEAEFALPASIGDYTDFYSSIHHATRVGRLFRPDQPLLPNYKWMPIAYHGRASSIAVSGQDFHRPSGQRLHGGAAARPQVALTARLDYELEVGVFVGPGNRLGQAIALDTAENHVFGLCLLNDWSARDIQSWEYQPLGPFLSKSFATTVSPWIVTLEALEPYRVEWGRPEDDPPPLAYLDSAVNRRRGAFDIQLEAAIQTAAMRVAGESFAPLSQSSFRHAYWTVGQMVAHHTLNGCNLRAGDLLGAGTQSGPTLDQAGCLLELTEGGQRPLVLPNGEARTFLEDGDAVRLRAWCDWPGQARIGFGVATGTVLPAI